MVIVLTSDMIMLWFAVFYLVSEVNKYFKELRTKQTLRHQSTEFTCTMQTLFDLKSPFDVVDCLDRNCAHVNDYVKTVLKMYAPELAEHHQAFQWVLLARRKLLRTGDMNAVAQDCYRFFMCVVMQLRVYGELRSKWAMEKFRTSFRHFTELHSLHRVAQRTWNVAREMRRIASELDKVEGLHDDNAEALLERFNRALDDVRELIGQE
jgi:hypothetical protein